MHQSVHRSCCGRAVGSGVRRSWEPPRLSPAGNEGYCVSKGYHCSRHCARRLPINPHISTAARPCSAWTPAAWLTAPPTALPSSYSALATPVSVLFLLQTTHTPSSRPLCLLLSLPAGGSSSLLPHPYQVRAQGHPSVQSSLTIPPETTTSPPQPRSVFLSFVTLPDSIF